MNIFNSDVTVITQKGIKKVQMLDITHFVKLSTNNDKRSWYKPLLLSGFFGVIFNSAKKIPRVLKSFISKCLNYWICSVSMKWTLSGLSTAVACLCEVFTNASLYIDFPIDLLEHLRHCAVLAACISLSLRWGSFVCALWLENPVGRQRQHPKAVSVSSRGQTQKSREIGCR